MAKSVKAEKTCPMELGINVLSGKWKLKILCNIYKRKVVRFNELQKILGNITTKTLIEQLRELEAKKIVKRKIYAEIPPKVEYSLTEVGKTIEPVLKSLCEWGKEYLEKIEKRDEKEDREV